jgi:hypothetical protein
MTPRPLPALRAHWFYEHESGAWSPFTQRDSDRLEAAREQGGAEAVLVRVEGGRCDVDLAARKRLPVYACESANRIRRATWFFGSDDDFTPFGEDDAEKVEEEPCVPSNFCSQALCLLFFLFFFFYRLRASSGMLGQHTSGKQVLRLRAAVCSSCATKTSSSTTPSLPTTRTRHSHGSYVPTQATMQGLSVISCLTFI